jgi:hypothetical protein
MVNSRTAHDELSTSVIANIRQYGMDFIISHLGLQGAGPRGPHGAGREGAVACSRQSCSARHTRMASLCHTPFPLPASRASSSHSDGNHSLFPALRVSKSVSVLRGSEEFRAGVKATVRSLGRQSVGPGSRVTMASSADGSSAAETEPRPFGVLFVCLGKAL